jgi:signal transduction histidine kinase
MRLFHKMAVVLVAAAALPLGTAGFALVAINQRALEAEVRAHFDQTARHAAEAVASDVEGRARQLPRLAAMIGWPQLGDDELRGALELFARQAQARASAFYGPDGQLRQLAPPGADAFVSRIPVERARHEGPGAVVFSAPFRDGGGRPTVAAALAVAGGVMALDLPLDGENQRLAEVRGTDETRLSLVDDRGELIAHSDRDAPAPAPSRAALADALAGKDGHARRYLEADGRGTIAAFAPVGGLGWLILVEEDAARAFAAPTKMRQLTLAWAGGAALVAFGLAFLFARRLSRALEGLAKAARALGRGQLDARVPVAARADARDEIAELGRTFNTMGEQIEASRSEIERWNRELEARVEARTRELKEAQAQLVQAQKLAALGQLGAGVAHEINNPLGGVIGHVQLLLAERSTADRDFEALRCIEEGARRASQVVQNLLRFSVQRHEPVRTTVDAARLVRDTLSLTETLLAESKIQVELALDGAPRLRGDAGQLGQVLLNLVSNARTAMPGGGTLRISARHAGAEAAVAVEDTGRGIAPEIRHRIFEPFFTTKADWSNVGLGLSVSYRIIEEHGGRIEVASEVGRGSTFTVYLPEAPSS